MKRAAILGERKAALIDVPDPQPKEDWALVKVHAAPMCTEYKAFVAGRKADYLGHEAAGEVVAIARPGRVAVGDRVVVMPHLPCGKCPLCVSGEYIHCQNAYNFEAFIGSREGSATMAQYLLKPSWLLPQIPDGVSYEKASLACCALGPSFGAFDSMGLDVFDSVLITGAGPVGLGATVNAAYRGARTIVVESEPYRVNLAMELGAEAVLEPGGDVVKQVMDMTDGVGVDCSLDCSGSTDAHRVLIDATRRKGKVAFVGECSDDLAIRPSRDMIRKGLTIIGSWHYNLGLFPALMQVIQHSPVIDKLITHVLPMSEIERAFEISASHKCGKIILKPWE